MADKEKILLSCKTVELSETKTYLELINRICFYDYPNLNGVELPSDTALEKAQTLVDMPVKAKYTVNSKGEPTFRGHEAYLDENGDIAFDTVPIGVHTDVYVQDDDVEIGNEIKHLPCLFAKQKIWTEKKNIVAACKRLFEEGHLHNSWEILSDAFEYKNGIKKLLDYVFTSNVFLGYDVGVDPAYGQSAKVISLSSKFDEGELLVAEALSKDLIESETTSKESEDNNLNDNITNTDPDTQNNSVSELPIESAAEPETTGDPEANPSESLAPENGTGEITGSEPTSNPIVSSLTEEDLRVKITKACRSKIDEWCWIAFHFPIEETVWVEYQNRASALDYYLFTYSVNDKEEVTVSEPEHVKLTVSVAEINKVLEDKNDALITLNSQMAELKAQVDELLPYKEEHERAEREKAKAEKEKQVSELFQYVTDANAFSEKELQSDEIKHLISGLNKSKLQEMIADRLVSNLRCKSGKTVESSTQRHSVQAETVDDNEINYKAVMSAFLK